MLSSEPSAGGRDLGPGPVVLDPLRQVREFAHANDYHFAGGWAKAADHPVHSLDWFDCVKWYNARSQSEHLTHCHDLASWEPS